jgi:phage shock protein PspC (stress-responsive transcriptional regulator)
MNFISQTRNKDVMTLWILRRAEFFVMQRRSMMDSQNAFWDSVRNLKKSATDKKIAGVCGGFGEHTPMPAWLWRALFLVLTFVWGVGLVAYIVLWICMPAADDRPKPEATHSNLANP